MLPDIDLRLDTIASALSEVVLPAVPAEECLAREHIVLAIAHLRMIKAQWRCALAFELGTFDAQCALARQLLPGLDDATLGAGISSALAAAGTLDRTDYDAVSRALKTLAALLDGAIRDYERGSPLEPALAAAVLDYGRREAWRQRVWFAGAGIDPDRDELPPIAALFD